MSESPAEIDESKSERTFMLVRCLGKECVGCPELEIEVNHYILSPIQDAINTLSCVNLAKCRMIKEHLRKNSNSDNEKDGV